VCKGRLKGREGRKEGEEKGVFLDSTNTKWTL